MIELFNEFYRKTKCYNNDLYEFLKEELSSITTIDKNFDAAIIDADDEDIRLFVLKFYDFLKDKGIYVNSNLKNYRLYKNDATARKIDILKQIQKRVSKSELIERYHVKERTIRNDINLLKYGTKILGVNIKLDNNLIIEQEGRNIYYRCRETAHPIFLLLNLTQINSFTNVLESLVKNNYVFDYNNSTFKNVIELMKNQLSENALEKLELNNIQNIEQHFVIEDEMISNNIGLIEKLIKTSQKCEMIIDEERYVGIFTVAGVKIQTLEGWKDLKVPHRIVKFKIIEKI